MTYADFSHPLHLFSLPEQLRHQMIKEVLEFRISDVSSAFDENHALADKKQWSLHSKLFAALNVKANYHQQDSLVDSLKELAIIHQADPALSLEQASKLHQMNNQQTVSKLVKEIGNQGHSYAELYLSSEALTKALENVDPSQIFNLGQSIINITNEANKEIDDKDLLPKAIQVLEEKLNEINSANNRDSLPPR